MTSRPAPREPLERGLPTVLADVNGVAQAHDSGGKSTLESLDDIVKSLAPPGEAVKWPRMLGVVECARCILQQVPSNETKHFLEESFNPCVRVYICKSNCVIRKRAYICVHHLGG